MPTEPALRDPPKRSARETPVVRSRDVATAAQMMATVMANSNAIQSRSLCLPIRMAAA